AAMRYFTQALGEDDPGRKDLLFDVATEEISHLEIIGSIIAMLNKGPKAVLSEGMEEAMEMRNMTQNSTSHTQQILYGGGPALVNSSGVPWTAAYVDSIGCPTADMRSNIAAEARAKLVYERLINVTDDPGIVDALRFLMTREVAHQKSFEKALYSIEPNFPPGKLPGDPRFTDKYYNTSQGEGDMVGPWNAGEQWEVVADRELQAAVDGGDGSATVALDATQTAALDAMSERLLSNPELDRVTGADLGAGPGAGSTTGDIQR
ncbi:manganese catalase family protein, partial [Xanthomonas vasicola]